MLVLSYQYNNKFNNFKYNGRKIKFDNNYSTTIGDLFRYDNNPIITVNDSNNLIGKKIKIIFKTNHGYKQEIICHSETTIGNLLKQYLSEIDEIFSIVSFGMNNMNYMNNMAIKMHYQSCYNHIQFLYKGHQIDWYNVDSKTNSIFYNLLLSVIILKMITILKYLLMI